MAPFKHQVETTDKPGVTTQLCDWIQGLKLEDVPVQVQTRAKYLILDGLACALTGARVPWSVEAAKAVMGFEEPGKHVIIGYEEVFLLPCTYRLRPASIIQSTTSIISRQLTLLVSRNWGLWPLRY